MKKTALYHKNPNEEAAQFCGHFDSRREAEEHARQLVDDTEGEGEEDRPSIFDYYTTEVEYTDICERVKSYADACEVLGIEPMDEDAMRRSGFRPDEIARRQVETITEALNEGWRPDWNNTDEPKYYPWWYIKPNSPGAIAGLANATSSYAATHTTAYIGSRLCFHERRTAAYAGDTFRDLYAKFILDTL